MKVVVRVLLVAAIILLAFLCWKSIQGPIDFNAEVKRRDNAVIQRLVDIRTTQVAYRTQKGSYTADFNELAEFIKTGKVASIARSGDLTEEQLEAGMTEAKAMGIMQACGMKVKMLLNSCATRFMPLLPKCFSRKEESIPIHWPSFLSETVQNLKWQWIL